MNTRRTQGQDYQALALTAAALVGLLASGCAGTQRPPVVIGAPTPARTEGQPQATPAVAIPSPSATPSLDGESRALARVDGDIVISVWTEPRRLPVGGGQAQVIVRVLKRSGRPLPGVEVRITSSSGTLFSQGKILTTDARGMARDSLTTTQATSLNVAAGGREQQVELRLGGTGLDD
jgi:hypothetical protein